MVLGASVPETGGRDQYTYFQLFHIPQVILRIKQVLEILSQYRLSPKAMTCHVG